MLISYDNVDILQEDYLVVKNASFELNEGEFVYFVGKVGSGKSSILKTIYAELYVKTGTAHVLGFNMCKLKQWQVPQLRRQLGVIFQDFQLLTDRSVRANLDFALRATGWKDRSERQKRIKEVLELVGLPSKISSMPHELSGGEKQRITIARAILNQPKIILADEPTGNLDNESGRKIMAILHEICHSGTAVIMTTHNMSFLQEFPGIVYRAEEGKLSEVTQQYNQPFAIDYIEKNEEEATEEKREVVDKMIKKGNRAEDIEEELFSIV